MSISKKDLPKAFLFVLSVTFLSLGSFYLYQKISHPLPEVASVSTPSLEGKFLDNFADIQLAGAVVNPTYQDIASDVHISGLVQLNPTSAPSPTTDKLYNVGGSLFWNGMNLSSGGLWTASGNNIYNSNSGNVGIGTTNPSEKLQLGGGNLRVGEINPVNTGTQPEYGRILYFSGGPSSAARDSENSDPLWLARYNLANDSSELRLNIGDYNGAEDALSVGYTHYSTGLWNSVFKVRPDGYICIGTDCRNSWGGGAKRVQIDIRGLPGGCSYTRADSHPASLYWDPNDYPGLTSFTAQYRVGGTNQGTTYIAVVDSAGNPISGTERTYTSDPQFVSVTVNTANLVAGNYYNVSSKIPSNCPGNIFGVSDAQFVIRM